MSPPFAAEAAVVTLAKSVGARVLKLKAPVPALSVILPPTLVEATPAAVTDIAALLAMVIPPEPLLTMLIVPPNPAPAAFAVIAELTPFVGVAPESMLNALALLDIRLIEPPFPVVAPLALRVLLAETLPVVDVMLRMPPLPVPAALALRAPVMVTLPPPVRL